jgi:hypothetical protein
MKLKDVVKSKKIFKEAKKITYDVSKVMDEPKGKYKSIFFKEGRIEEDE